MEWLNYHHLLYFWKVARSGSIANASKELLLAPPTISAQVSHLEDTLGEKLFVRSGRRLVLTEAELRCAAGEIQSARALLEGLHESGPLRAGEALVLARLQLAGVDFGHHFCVGASVPPSIRDDCKRNAEPMGVI